MPTQERPRTDKQRETRRRRQVTGSRGEQSPIRQPKLRPADLPAQHRDLMPEHEQLDILDVRATAATNEQAE
jgi:hypothetical protein